MGKASTGKKVARAASTGGGRTARGTTPWGWYSVMGAVVLIGVVTIAFSRSQRVHQLAHRTHPYGHDHWHAAYAIDICGQVQPNLPQPQDLIGLHTHTDGLIHVEPFVTSNPQDAGHSATLARFAQGEPGFKLTSSELRYPGGKTYHNGDKCGAKKGLVQIKVWPKAKETAAEFFSDPKDVRIKDGQGITIAFLPAGAEMSKPTTISNLANPNAKESGGTGQPVSTPPGGSPAGSGTPSSSP